MNCNPVAQPIQGINLSHAWASAIIKCYEASGSVLSPAMVQFPAFGPNDTAETPEIRTLVDSQLANPKMFIPNQSVVETVAGTIFPESIWLLSRGDRQILYKKYVNMLSHIKCKQSNRRGVYFQRMIAYPPADGENEPINQLEHIITTWNSGNHRHSALQVGIFDPRTDHSDARLWGFPCLQQVAFHANGSNGKDGLTVTAFYATQTLEEKAYGNYLGLLRLGKFMAKEMGLQLKEVVCIASALKLNNNGTKARCEPLIKALKAVLKKVGE